MRTPFGARLPQRLKPPWMAAMDVTVLTIIITTFFLAGVVKGVSGMGLPTVAMGVLGAVLSPLSAAALLVFPSFLTNVWQLLTGPSLAVTIRRLWPMMLAVVVATILGASLIVSGEVRLITAGLGAVLAAYGLYGLFGRPLVVAKRHERALSPVIGAATGLVTGATGVFVVPAVPYIQALGLSKDELVQALGLSFTVSTVALALGLAFRGAFTLDGIWLSVAAAVPAFAGMAVGERVRSRLSPPLFRRWFLIGLVLLGLEMLSRPFR